MTKENTSIDDKVYCGVVFTSEIFKYGIVGIAGKIAFDINDKVDHYLIQMPEYTKSITMYLDKDISQPIVKIYGNIGQSVVQADNYLSEKIIDLLDISPETQKKIREYKFGKDENNRIYQDQINKNKTLNNEVVVIYDSSKEKSTNTGIHLQKTFPELIPYNKADNLTNGDFALGVALLVGVLSGYYKAKRVIKYESK